MLLVAPLCASKTDAPGKDAEPDYKALYEAEKAAHEALKAKIAALIAAHWRR